MTHKETEQYLLDVIRETWGKLTDDEISFYTTMRDMFFMAVRKKYGTPRMQAEHLLRTIEQRLVSA